MNKKPNRQETEAKINARAWKNPAFKKQLLANPQMALKEMGLINLPPNIKISVIEEKENQWCLVLRMPPQGYAKMSEEELQKISAAAAADDCD